VPEGVTLGKARSVLGVPLLRHGEPLGAISLARQRVEPFTERQIELVRTFADQAVIAIENTRLITETREALEQQTATAEVLQVINSSPGDLAPVFDAILEKAHKLCDVAYGSLELYDGTNFRAVATIGYSDTFADLVTRGYVGAESPDTRALIEGERFAHVLDLAETDALMTRTAAQLEGHSTLLCVPLRREDKLLGMIATARKEVRPFSDKEIALLENFAAQAVIAMENARLLTETREALEQQTATAEVLQVINSSPGDLGPVFDAILSKAMGLCEAAHGHVWIYDGERAHPVAVHGEPQLVEWMRRAGSVGPGPDSSGRPSPLGRVVRGEPIVHVADARKEESYRSHPVVRELVDVGGIRTILDIALRKGDAPLGIIALYRQQVCPFTEKQIALLQNFAAQRSSQWRTRG
jgi:GAF domain-containing protein